MKITAYGAASEVTGSCHMVEADGKRLLIDCGQFQGDEDALERSMAPFPFDPAAIDALILTHGHLDHIGRVPLLVQEGFRGKILTTAPTREIGRLILVDAAHVMREEHATRSRKARRAGRTVNPPPWDIEQVLDTMDYFESALSYGEPYHLADGLTITLHNAGHILGSAFAEIEERAGASAVRALFSGDLGNRGREVMPDPELPPTCDVVAVEATYGDREHRSMDDSQREFRQAVLDALERGGNVIIPTFALERAQDVLYELRLMWHEGLLAHPRIFLDSPLAISITRVYRRYADQLNPDLRARIHGGEDPFMFPGVFFTRSTEESQAINRSTGGNIILAGAGMLNGGRVLHHLRHNLWREECSVIFVGYQAAGTLGRRIVDAEPRVRIFGEEIAVKARVYTINGFSAHADRRGIVDWLRSTGHAEVLLIHGEEKGLQGLSTAVREELGRKVTIARPGESHDFTTSRAPQPVG